MPPHCPNLSLKYSQITVINYRHSVSPRKLSESLNPLRSSSFFLFFKIFDKCLNKEVLSQTQHNSLTQFFTNPGHISQPGDLSSEIPREFTRTQILRLAGPRASQLQDLSNHDYHHTQFKPKKNQSHVQVEFFLGQFKVWSITTSQYENIPGPF